MLAAAAVVTLAGNAAHAGGYPTKLNVATWYGVANNYEIFINVSTESSATPCNQITGQMGNKGSPADSIIQGYYCPATGKVTFLRKNKVATARFPVLRRLDEPAQPEVCAAEWHVHRDAQPERPRRLRLRGLPGSGQRALSAGSWLPARERDGRAGSRPPSSSLPDW